MILLSIFTFWYFVQYLGNINWEVVLLLTKLGKLHLLQNLTVANTFHKHPERELFNNLHKLFNLISFELVVVTQSFPVFFLMCIAVPPDLMSNFFQLRWGVEKEGCFFTSKMCHSWFLGSKKSSSRKNYY